MNHELLIQFLSQIVQIIISEKDVATQLTMEFIRMACIRFDGIVPYINVGTYWQKIARKDIPSLIRNIISPAYRSMVKSGHITETIKRLTDDIQLKLNVSESFWKQQDLLNFKNGVLNIVTGEFTTDRNNYIFDYVINSDYLPDCTESDAPNFMHFIKTSVGEENKECLLRSTGYIISSKTDAKKAIFVIGAPDGGKSTYLKVIASAVSPELISNVSFSQISDPHYTMQYLGKRMNISYDNSSKPMDHEDVFKSITSNETITGRELYESPVQFTPTLKQIYASNYPFNFKNPDEALYKRMIIIPFEYSVPPEKQDKQLFQKLLNEKNVILSLASKSLKALIESDYDFRMSDKGKAYIANRIAMLHSAEDFLDDRTVCDECNNVSSAVLFSHYEEWCRDNALKPIPRHEFMEHVLAYSPQIIRCKIGPREKRVWGFKGIRLKNAGELNTPDNMNEVK